LLSSTLSLHLKILQTVRIYQVQVSFKVIKPLLKSNRFGLFLEEALGQGLKDLESLVEIMFQFDDFVVFEPSALQFFLDSFDELLSSTCNSFNIFMQEGCCIPHLQFSFTEIGIPNLHQQYCFEPTVLGNLSDTFDEAEIDELLSVSICQHKTFADIFNMYG
jgi:hypothetical protein